MTVTLLSAQEIQQSWTWLKNNLSQRPTTPSGKFLYDSKRWPAAHLANTATTNVHLTRLYLTSLFGSVGQAASLVTNNTTTALKSEKPLDDQILAVIDSEHRFRNGLAEHLAYWTRMADGAKTYTNIKFAQTPPHIQPEDKGHDGLLLTDAAKPLVEVQSVKSSLKSPREQIASAGFRKKGKPEQHRQLDDFYSLSVNRMGTARLARMIEQLTGQLQMTTTAKLKAVEKATGAYNAVVFAGHRYDKSSLFDGFHRIGTSANQRIATYVGVNAWPKLAEAVRARAMTILAPHR